MEFTWKMTSFMGVGTKMAPLLHACQADQRFSYYLYLPKGFSEENADNHKMLVAIHDTFRNAESLKNRFAEFADQHQCVVLAPLFPTGIVNSHDIHNYKFLAYEGIRFDRVIFSMIEEVGEIFGIPTDKFLMYGFSGGGQFAHRFLYLYPERLNGVAIGAPGRITYLDENVNWPNGIKDVEEVLGKKVLLEEVKKVPVFVFVGEKDNQEVDYSGEPGDDAGDSRGKTRLEKVSVLAEEYINKGLQAALKVVADAAHDDTHMLPKAIEFFEMIC